MRQHLLQGFGFNSNLRWIRIARNDRAIMDAAYQNQIMTTVSQIENIYWDLVNAYENVKVQQRALELADKTLSDTQKAGGNRHPGADHGGAVARARWPPPSRT